MKRVSLGMAGLLVLCGAIGVSDAAVIFDNQGPDLVGGRPSDFDPSNVAFALPNQVADDFVLTADASTISDVHWFGGYDFGVATIPAADDFTIRIFDDDSGVPDTSSFITATLAGAVTRVDTGDNLGVFDVFEYSVDVDPIPLTAGTTFWLSIVNDTTGVDSDWFWADSATGAGNAADRSADGEAWVAITPVSREMAFNLTGDVTPGVIPEPSTFAIWSLLGIVGLAWGWRRRGGNRA